MKTFTKKIFSISIILFLLLFPGVQKVYALSAGDISILGFNSNLSNRDGFAFVTWVDLPIGTVIKFTDNGFNTNTSALGAGNFRDLEQTATWTATAIVPTGSVVTIEGNGSSATFVANTGSVTVTNADGTGTTNLNLGNAGDQIFAFQGGAYITGNSSAGQMAANTVMLYGIGFQGIGTTTGWLTTGTAGSATSYLPTQLGTYNLFFASNAVAAEYTGARTGLTIPQFKAAVNNISNWTLYTTGGVTTYNTTAFPTVAAPSITTQPSNSSVCAGTSTSFTVVASNATTYQWRVNTGSGYANITDGGVYSNSATATLNLTGVTAGMNGYKYKVAVTGSGGSDTSSEVTLTVTSPGTWLGTTSTAWSNTANWSCATLPTSFTNVTIPSGTTYSPLIDSTNVVANNLTINPGATLGFSTTTKIISISGVLTNNGTFTTTGRIAFAGTSQTIPAMTYAKLQITGGGSKSLSGATTITDSLIFTSGYILLGNFNLTLGGTGRIGGGTSTASYCVVNGTGGLVQQNLGSGGRTGTVSFPLGISTTSFTPLRINNTGTADAFTGRVINHVYDGYTNDVPTGPQITDNVVDRTWTFTEAVAGGSNATVTVQWNGVDQLGTFDPYNCVLSHYTGGDWTNNGRPFSTASGFDPYTLSRSAITSFSPFGVGGPSSPLPVKLIGFAGAYASGNVNLNWTVAQESGIHQYDVERSNNGSDFKQIGESVAARNSEMEYKYSFTDAPVTTNTTLYYRLHIINQDGTSSYSQVVKINTGNKADYGVVLISNPVKESVDLKVTSFEAETAVVRITDLAGRTVASKSFAVANGTQTISMPVNALAGNKFYLVKVSIGNQSYEYKVLIN